MSITQVDRFNKQKLNKELRKLNVGGDVCCEYVLLPLLNNKDTFN